MSEIYYAPTNAMCDDLTVRRAYVRSAYGAWYADTAFTAPAYVRVRGRHVSGYVTGNEARNTDPGAPEIAFVATGKNRALIEARDVVEIASDSTDYRIARRLDDWHGRFSYLGRFPRTTPWPAHFGIYYPDGGELVVSLECRNLWRRLGRPEPLDRYTAHFRRDRIDTRANLEA